MGAELQQMGLPLFPLKGKILSLEQREDWRQVGQCLVEGDQESVGPDH